jgi:purine-nucleoside phosphorylase
MDRDLSTMIHEAADYLRGRGVTEPDTGVILGTGLNNYVDVIEDPIIIPYGDIPYMNPGRVDGHRGQLIYGRRRGKTVVIMAGRYHYYESGDIHSTAFPARVLIELGISRLIITNAAGCVNKNWKAGQLMLISDHINLSGQNPLIGVNLNEYGPRFPDMTYTYDKELRAGIMKRAREEGIELTEGVYTMMTGPSFETPAEINMIRVIGGDAVGMSSVPEAIIAGHAGIEVVGISLLSNMAAGVLNQPLTADEVTEAGKMIEKDFSKVLDIALEV